MSDPDQITEDEVQNPPQEEAEEDESVVPPDYEPEVMETYDAH